MLGDQWKVENFGLSGTTLMNSGNKPYQKTKHFKRALASKADVVVIMLGTNDTKPENWKHFKTDFEKDYRDLIADFQKMASKPQIYLCLPPYIAKEGRWGINNDSTKEQIPVVTKLAKELKLGLIDVYSALEGHDDLIPDTVHPNTAGATRIAEAVVKVLAPKK
jgi:lysophospholipase L1-like esterase